VGIGPAYFWTSALRLQQSSALAQGEDGNWQVCAYVCISAGKVGLAGEQLARYF